MPAIVDHGAEGGPVSIFESGAILVHLARRSGRFMPTDEIGYKETLEWLFWQTGNLGPMAGQHSHFRNYAPEWDLYGRERYANEFGRCIGVLERRLERREFILGDYSIVDMACFPWILIAPRLDEPLERFPNVSAWRQRIKARPAVQAGVDLGKELKRSKPMSEEDRRRLFEQSAELVEEQIRLHEHGEARHAQGG
jgi:GST-like protein